MLLARFKAALVDAVRVTYGHPVSPDSVHVYRRCPESPTGVSHVMSIDRDWPEVQELLCGVSATEWRCARCGCGARETAALHRAHGSDDE